MLHCRLADFALRIHVLCSMISIPFIPVRIYNTESELVDAVPRRPPLLHLSFGGDHEADILLGKDA